MHIVFCCRDIATVICNKVGQVQCTDKSRSESQESLTSPASQSCIILAFYPSSCMALSAGQLPRKMYPRLMLLINGVNDSY